MVQDLLIYKIIGSNKKHLTNFVYTYLYVCKVLSRFGFIGPLLKTFGFNVKRRKSRKKNAFKITG